MNQSTDSIDVARERLQRLLDAVHLASTGDYESCLQRFGDSGDDDRFAELEISFSVFVRELAGSKAATAAALSRRESAAREVQERIATIELQNLTIRELSTPIIEVWDGVLCLPLVGFIDGERSASTTERLLESVVATQANAAIVDITGVELIDTRIADQLIKMSKAVRLLGADCVLSGINPRIAQTLTSLGIELHGLSTVRSLRDGLERILGLARTPARGAAATWAERNVHTPIEGGAND